MRGGSGMRVDSKKLQEHQKSRQDPLTPWTVVCDDSFLPSRTESGRFTDVGRKRCLLGYADLVYVGLIIRRWRWALSLWRRWAVGSCGRGGGSQGLRGI